jgi:hypothetical protein
MKLFRMIKMCLNEMANAVTVIGQLCAFPYAVGID